MIPLLIRYGEYIDCPKLTEQKTVWVYCSSPAKVGRNKNGKLRVVYSNYKKTLFFKKRNGTTAAMCGIQWFAVKVARLS